MSLILNIDSSTDTATISLAENGIELTSISNTTQKDHAAFLHIAIRDLMQKMDLPLTALSAIAVTIGPGSYTGLRVSMASAKGLCYALSKPFICLGTLRVMANAVATNMKQPEDKILLCPMIDARRMEVFTALFDFQLNIISGPVAMILDENAFKDILQNHKVYFFGNGAGKFQPVMVDKNATFLPIPTMADSMNRLSFEKFLKKEFTDLINSEPLYIKEFYSSPDKLNIV